MCVLRDIPSSFANDRSIAETQHLPNVPIVTQNQNQNAVVNGIKMLTQAGCQQRVQNLWNRIPEDIHWLLIADARHIQYLSNFRPNPISFSADQSSLLLLERSGPATLLTVNFTRRTAITAPFVDNEINIPWYTHKKSVGNRDHALVDALNECMSVWSATDGLIETEAVTHLVSDVVSATASASTTDLKTEQTATLGEILRDLRRQKLPDEVELLKACMRAGDAGHAAAFDAAVAGNSELDVYLAVQMAAEKQAGGPCVVYGDFRATNAKQHKAGGLPTDYILQDGDLFILDYSVVINGYRSDFTNTIAVGTPNDAQVKQFEACRDAIAAAESELKPQADCSKVYEAASAVFTQRGFPALAHHCGHGLGMEHPEPPILVPESTDTLRVGDVITIEPGLYVEGVGGMRFEHNYLITEAGYERLSNHHIGLTR